jgi:acyl carrier protein
MAPSAFVLLDALPRTPNGKINRKALPAASDTLMDLGKDYVVPRTSLERELAGIFAEVLGVKRVGLHDDFFELGGHSLLVARAVARIRNAMSIEVPFRTLFVKTTVADLARHIEALQYVDGQSTVPGKADDQEREEIEL